MTKDTEEIVTGKNGEPVKIVTKKRSSCGATFRGFLLSLLFIVICVVGFGAYVYFGVTINQIEKLVGTELPIDGEIRHKSVKELITLALETKDSYVNMTIGEVKTKLGVNLPEKIPGTDISITYLYDSDVTFQEKTTKVNDIKLMSAVNDLNSFVDAVLPVVYEHVTVGELLDTASMTKTLNDMGYPALSSKIYNMGTTENPNYKQLSELTISQVQNVLTDYYGKENLTVDHILTATGLDVSSIKVTLADGFGECTLNTIVDWTKTLKISQIIDTPVTIDSNSTTTDKLLYAIRNVKVDDILKDEPLDKVLAVVDSEDGYPNFKIKDLVDMSQMTNAEMFGDIIIADLLTDTNQTINNKIDTLTLGDFVSLSGVVEDDFFTNNTLFKALENNKDIKLSKLVAEIEKLTLSQLLTTAQANTLVANHNITSAELDKTLIQLLNDRPSSTINDILGNTIVEELGGFIKELKTNTKDNFKTNLEALNIKKVLGEDASAVASLAKLNIGDILKDQDALITIVSEFGTIGELCGNSTTGIMSIIKDIRISDLMTNPDAIVNTLKSSTKTLSEMLDIDSNNSLITIIAGIKVGDLFTDAETAIQNALYGTGNNNTLATILGMDMSTATGINKIVGNIKMYDLMNNSANAFKTALSNATDVALKDIVTVGTNPLMIAIQDITVADLFGSNPGQAIYNALSSNTMTLETFLNKTTTGVAHTVLTGLTLQDLFGSSNLTTKIETLINDIYIGDVFDVTDTASILYKIINKPGNETLKISGLQNAINQLTLRDMFDTYMLTNDAEYKGNKNYYSRSGTSGSYTYTLLVKGTDYTVDNSISSSVYEHGPESGILSLPGINLDVSISNMTDAFTGFNINNIDIGTLITKGIVNAPEGTNANQWSGITLAGVLVDYISHNASQFS